jgi:hypothetical protein
VITSSLSTRIEVPLGRRPWLCRSPYSSFDFCGYRSAAQRGSRGLLRNEANNSFVMNNTSLRLYSWELTTGKFRMTGAAD